MPRSTFWGMISFNSGQNLTFFDLGPNYIHDLKWRWKTLKLVFWKLMSNASVLNTTSVFLATCVIWPLLHRYTGNAGADKIFEPNLPRYKPKLTDLVKLDYSYKSTCNRKLFFRDMLMPKNNFGLMRYIYRYNKKLYGSDKRKKDSNLIASYTEMQNFELKFLINKYRLLQLSNRWADGSKFDFSKCEFPRTTG